jgi:hypothetical protein
MGYRSDFVLIVHGNDDTRALAKLWVWLHTKAEEETKDRVSTYYSGWYSYLIENVVVGKSAPHEDFLFFEDDSVKLYGFDSVLNEITRYTEEILGLEWEYTCMGEETDDIKEHSSSNCDRRSWIVRSIQVN